MLTISNKQLAQLAQPGLVALTKRALVSLKKEYLVVTEDQSDDSLLEQLFALLSEAQKLHLEYDDNIEEFIIICIRYQTNYALLLKHPKIGIIIKNEELNEYEKVYLIHKILYNS